MNINAVTALAINYEAIPANLHNLSGIVNTGNQLASIFPDAKFSKPMGDINSLSNAVSAAKQGNYIASGMALTGLDPNSEIAKTMGYVGSASNVVSALRQGSALGAGMALAGALPGSDFSEVMGKIAQAQDLYNQVKSIFTLNMDASDLIMHLQPPTSSPVQTTTTPSKNLTMNGSDGAYIENGQISLEPHSCVASTAPDGKSLEAGAPVSSVYGSKILTGSEDLDFVGRGYLSFGLARTYNSQNSDIGWFGQGWASTGFEQRLEVDEYGDRIYLIDNSGREVPFTYINDGETCYQPFENLTLYRSHGLNFIVYMGEHVPNSINSYNSVAQHFGYCHHVTHKGTFIKATLLPSKQTDQYGHQLQLHYTQTQDKFQHLPSHITDDAGDCYQLEFANVANSDNNKPSPAQSKAPPIPRFIRVSLLTDLDTNHTIAEYRYNQTGDLIQVIKGDKTAREFTYTDHLMTWQRLPNGRQAHYRYDNTDNAKTAKVIEHWIDNGEHYHFDYHSNSDDCGESPNSHLTTVTEQKGSPLERQTIYQYNDKHFITALTDPNGNTTKYEYDPFNKLKYLTHADGTYTKYNHQGNQLNNIETLTGHDTLTNLPQYRKTDYQFDDEGNLASVTNALGHKTQFIYNQHKQVSQNTNANGHSTHYDYDGHGNLIKQTLANGSQFKFDYDALGQLISQTDCSGYQTRYEYDLAGRMTVITDPEGSKTELFYIDKLTGSNRAPVRIRHANGTVENFVYDDNNRLVEHSDAKAQSTQYEYDTDDLPIKRINAQGYSLTYEYDELRRLSKLTNENGEVWAFTYDKADNLISETRFDGYTSHYKYNVRNQLIEQIDNPMLDKQHRRHIYLQRDMQGQLIAKHSIDYHSDTNAQNDKAQQRRQHKSEYEYDILGNIVKAISPDASTHLEYDKLGLLIRETLYRHHGEFDIAEQVLTHEYDELGNRIATTLPDGKQLKQLYYGSGHLYNQSLTDNDGNVIEIRHSSTNKRHQEISCVQGQLESLYRYDKMGQLTQSRSTIGQSGTDTAINPVATPVIEKNYIYDQLGQLTTFSGSTQLGHNATMQRRHQYHYDPLGRLTEHKLTDYAQQIGLTERFAFDPASNRVPVNVESSEGGIEEIKEDQLLDKNKSVLQSLKPEKLYEHKSKKWKRITELTTHDKYITYEYDHHGRILHKTQTPLGNDDKPLKQSCKSIVGYLESLQLHYNPNNELDKSIKIEQKGLDVCVTTTTYHYDAFGRRIAKRSTTQNQSKLTPKHEILPYQQTVQYDKNRQQTSLMLWDGNRPIQEYSDSHVFTTVYEQNSFAPVARLVWLKQALIDKKVSEKDKQWLIKFNQWALEQRINPRGKFQHDDGYVRKHKLEDILGIKVFYYHNDQLGTPNELTNAKGDVVWAADYNAWGNIAKEEYDVQIIDNIELDSIELQPIRFQGQSIDEETGLHYNRFRYYDNDVGMFISRDPIGLLGGKNVFQYAPNPTGWIDPLGLNLWNYGIGTSNSGVTHPITTLNYGWNNLFGGPSKGQSVTTIYSNTTQMTQISASAAALGGFDITAGAGASYDAQGKAKPCFAVTVCGSSGAQGGASLSATHAVTHASSSDGLTPSLNFCGEGTFATGIGATGGACIDSSTGVPTEYAGMAAGGEIGAAAKACGGLAYCFPSESKKDKFIKQVEKERWDGLTIRQQQDEFWDQHD